MAITFTRDDGTVSVAGLAPAAAVVPADPARLQSGTLLVELFHYLEQHAVQRPVLLPAVTALREAVAEYRAGTAQDPFAGVRGVVERIGSARAADPSLPAP